MTGVTVTRNVSEVTFPSVSLASTVMSANPLASGTGVSTTRRGSPTEMAADTSPVFVLPVTRKTSPADPSSMSSKLADRSSVNEAASSKTVRSGTPPLTRNGAETLWTSNAPMSVAGPDVRANGSPRWSKASPPG